MITILNQFAEKWCGWELAMLWQAGLLIAIVAAIDLLIKKWAWPQVRYALWMLILVKLVLPPGLTSPTSFTAEIPFMFKQAAVKINQPQIQKQIAESTNSDIKPIPVVVVPKQVEIASPEARNDIAVPATAKQAFRRDMLSWKVYVMFVWAGGVAILAGWLVIRLSSLRREHLEDESQILPERLEGLLAAMGHKLNLRRIPQVILTDKVCCPAVFGVFRPVLLMPADKLQNMTARDAENVFLHELAHIKRGDLLVHAIYMILQIAYWFNPLVWLARKPLQNLRELCCDATVARMLREKTAGYRQTLLDTARELLAVPVDPGLGLLGLFENSSWLLDRLRWLEKKSWKYRPLRIATVFVLICLMSACVLPMAKFQAPADFVIRGTVTDAQTGKPIAGAKVGDVEYAEGQFSTVSDTNGNYNYKTYYEEHGVEAIAGGYQKEKKTLLTKVFGREKEKVINFVLIAAAGSAPASEPEKRAGEAENKLNSQDNIADPVQIKNIMITMGGIFNAARTAIQSPGGGTNPAAKIMEDALPQFEKFESAIEGTNISDSVHLIIEQIRQAIKAHKEGDSPRVAALIGASGDSWNQLINVVVNEISEKKQEDRYKEPPEKMEKDSGKPAGQDEGKNEKSGISEMNSKIDKIDIDKATGSDVIKIFGEPTKYIWVEQVFEKNNLPDRYIMVYPGSFRVFIKNDSIIEFRFEGPSDYVFGEGLVVGSSIEKAFDILGRPSETVEGKPNEFKDNVLYKDIDGRKGRGYYARPEKNIRIWISDDKVCAIYLTRSDFRGSAGGGKELKEAELPKTSFIDKDGRIVDKIDYPFVTDTNAIGGWEGVDFVKNIEDFKPGSRSWTGNLFLKELFLLEGGKTNLGFTWTKGLLLHSVSKTASKYIIREIDGSKYMFMEWKSGDYTIRHEKPAYYVLKQNKDAVYVESRTTDKVDFSFVNDPRVLGKWQSVDFVEKIEQFEVGKKLWPESGLFLKELVFLPDGKMSVPWYTWTKGLVLHSDNRTASRYVIKELQGSGYMFFEWKSGDYTIRGMKPQYYVLKKITSQEDIDRNLPLELKAFDEWSTANSRKYFDCDGNNWLADYEEKTIQQLNGSNTDDYYSAINRLACMRSKKAIPLIAAIAFNKSEKDNRDRWMATRALGLIGEKTAIGDLIHLMYHYNNNTRLYARVSLIRLGCKDLGPDWRRWAAWYKYKIDNHFSTRKIEWTKDKKLADERLQIQKDQSWLKNLKDDWEIKNKYRQ